ncbi:MAG: GNAT family N-acetyltransferase [Candidatus Bathyarchaeia archaeon]|jgi:N-acetylglutamate synthase-like GNAT family acetyltransferase
MPLSIVYRRGSLEDLSRLQISEGLSATTESIEFNVLGIGHEFWIAVEEGRIIGLTVLSRSSVNEIIIVYLEVAPSHKSRGVGTGLIQAILDHYPQSEFSVIPFDGTEEFYKRLGFESAKNWEMRKRASYTRAK